MLDSNGGENVAGLAASIRSAENQQTLAGTRLCRYQHDRCQ
jgi:hypothetical protein